MELLEGNIHQLIRENKDIAIKCQNVTEINLIRMILREHGKTWYTGEEYKNVGMRLISKDSKKEALCNTGYFHFIGRGSFSFGSCGATYIKASSLDYGDTER